jgi:orotidine 5'-phosphate decarboxylase subfamily 2
MTSTSFFSKLEARVQEVNSHLCIGLDPHSKDVFGAGITNSDGSSSSSSAVEMTPQERCDATFTFCKTLIDATIPYAACYKPNAAFFEALGDKGAETLVRVLKEIPSSIPLLLDVKRGDIGSTASAYAEACYDHIGADSVTLSPLMGWDSVEPFVTGE